MYKHFLHELFSFLLLFLLFGRQVLANQSILFTTSEELCTDKKVCDNVDGVYAPSEVEQCTEELLIQYGNDKQGYLTTDGQIKTTPTITECSNNYKSTKYAFKNHLIDVIKHKNSQLVKNFKTEPNKQSHSSSIGQYMKEKFDDFLQYCLIFLELLGLIIITVFGVMCKVFSTQMIKRFNFMLLSKILIFKMFKHFRVSRNIHLIPEELLENGINPPRTCMPPRRVPGVSTITIHETSPPPPSAPQKTYNSIEPGSYVPPFNPYTESTLHQGHSQQFRQAPNEFNQGYRQSLIRAAKSVSNVSQPQQIQKSSSTVSLKGPAKGRTYSEKRINDVQCERCYLWFTTGISIKRHLKTCI